MKTKLILIILCLSITSLAKSQELYMYVSDAANFNSGDWQIIRYNIDGSNPQIFINEELGWPQDIVFLENDGVALISNLITGRITKHNATTGEFIEDFALVTGGPTRMKIGADGLLYVLQWSNTNNKILRYQLDGTLVDEFTDIGVAQSIGMDWDADGNLYISSYGGANVRKFDSSGTDQGVYVDTELSGPTNIWFGNNGHLFVLDWSAGNVEEFDETGAYVGTFISGLSQPEGIAFLENGNILIGNGGTSEIKQFDSTGTFIENTVESGAGGLDQPNAIVLREAKLGVEDQQLSRSFVYPTIGSQFSFILKDPSSIIQIAIYDMSGSLIEKFNPTPFWNAKNYSEGIYLVVTTHINGSSASQKIIVKHN